MTNLYLSITSLTNKFRQVAAAALFLGVANVAGAVDLQQLAEALKQAENYTTTIDALLTVPMSPNDVEYELKIAATCTQGDTLSPIDYLIAWTHPTSNGQSTGFTSYFKGNLYRYRDGDRLKEYHADANITPFTSSVPIQSSVQFYELIPQVIGQQIESMMADSVFLLKFYPDTVFNGDKAIVLKAVEFLKGSTIGELTFVFDHESLMPRYINKEMSPMSISEQTLTYKYREAGGDIMLPRSETELIALYPDQFANFREGNYGLNSLKGRPLPSFSLPRLGGDRYTSVKGQSISMPTVMVFLDEGVGSTPDVIKLTRKALDAVPMSTQVVWVFISNRQDDIADLFSSDDFVAETVLYSGRTMVKDFGVTETPSFIFIDRKGIVRDTATGFNNDLSEIVIQKTTLLN